MKNLFLLLFLFFLNNHSFSQDTYLMPAVDKAPVIEDCIDIKDTKDCFNKSLNHHIQTNLDLRKTYHAAGKAYVQFTITAEGQVQDVKVRAEDDKLREEAKRVIEILKIKNPATLNGEKVAVIHSLPLTFRTKNYNSVEEYKNSEIYKQALARKIKEQEKAIKEIVPFEEVASPPLYNECESIPQKKDCFARITEIKLKLHFENSGHHLDKGTTIKYYFQVDTEGKVLNTAVNGPGKLSIRIATELLESLTFLKPALDNDGAPVKTEYSGELVF